MIFVRCFLRYVGNCNAWSRLAPGALRTEAIRLASAYKNTWLTPINSFICFLSMRDWNSLCSEAVNLRIRQFWSSKSALLCSLRQRTLPFWRYLVCLGFCEGGGKGSKWNIRRIQWVEVLIDRSDGARLDDDSFYLTSRSRVRLPNQAKPGQVSSGSGPTSEFIMADGLKVTWLESSPLALISHQPMYLRR